MSLAKDVRREETLRYERHQPEQTLLYQIIEKYYPQFLAHMTQQDTYLHVTGLFYLLLSLFYVIDVSQ